MSFDPGPEPLCPATTGLSVRFATLARIFFDYVNTNYRDVVVHNGDIARRGKALGKKMPPMGGAQLSSSDLDAVAAYVWALGHRSGH
jgi:mono/diheme cytochrome c family protein